MSMLPPALAALSFLMSGGIGQLKRQFDTDPQNNPSLLDWGKTAGWTALGAAAPMGLPALPQAGAGLLLSGGLSYPGRLLDSDPNNNPGLMELAGTGMAAGLPFAFPGKSLTGALGQTIDSPIRPPTVEPVRPVVPEAAAVPAVQDLATVPYGLGNKFDDELIAASKAALAKGEPLSGPTAGPAWEKAGQFWREDAASKLPVENWRVNERKVILRKLADAGLLDSNPQLLDVPDLRDAMTFYANGGGSLPAHVRYINHAAVNGPEAAAARYGGPNVQMKLDELKKWAGLPDHSKQTMEDRIRGNGTNGRTGRGIATPSNTTGQDSFRVYGTNNPPLEMPPGMLNRPAPIKPSLQEMLWSTQSIPDQVSVPAGMHDANAFTQTVKQVEPSVTRTKPTRTKAATRLTAAPADPETAIRQTITSAKSPRQAILQLAANETIAAPADVEMLKRVLPDAENVIDSIVSKQGRIAQPIRETLEDMIMGPRIPLVTRQEEQTWAGLRTAAERRAFEQQVAQKHGIKLNNQSVLETKIGGTR